MRGVLLSQFMRSILFCLMSATLVVTGCARAVTLEQKVAARLQPASDASAPAEPRVAEIGATPNNNVAQVSPALAPTPVEPPIDPYALPLHLPGPATRIVARDARITTLSRKNEKYPTYDAYRTIAQWAVEDGNYDEAARNYRVEAAMYRKKGDSDAAMIEEMKASRYDTDVRLFADRDVTDAEFKAMYSGALLEPPVGCYVGAFIDRDEQLEHNYQDENWQTHRLGDEFTQLVAKPHASYFMYVGYGQRFPRRWVEECKKENAIPQIAWEPTNLHDVNDDDYLNGWAKACAAEDWPILIRYASEMNGFWTPYHSDPKLYIQKFQLVHRVLHHYAPRVATIWCVNNPPLNNLMDYYPGDDSCDWVGLNFYSVPFYDNDPSRSAAQDSPIALLDPVYRMFAARKPIAICEYAASHMAAADHLLRNDLAIDKLSQLYTALPRLYPRVKLIDWFDMDNLRNAEAGRQLNNYNVTEQAPVLAAYRDAIKSPYFLSQLQFMSDPRPQMPRPLLSGQQVHGFVRFSVWVKTYVARPKIYFKVGSSLIYASNRPGANTIDIDTRSIPVGNVPITVYVYDNHNRFITSSSTSVTVLHG